MAQHDYNIVNAGGATVRSDINNAFAAILSNNSGATEPTTTVPFMWWYDTANQVFKVRNAANSDWDELGDLVGGGAGGGNFDLISEHTSSGSTISIAIPSGYDRFEIHLFDIANGSAGDLSLSCYIISATPTQPVDSQSISGVTVSTASGGGAETDRFFLHANTAGTNWGNQAEENWDGIITLENPGSALEYAVANFKGTHRDSTGGNIQYVHGAAVRRHKSRITTVRIEGNVASTMTGTAKLYGYLD